jgi:hypothetical protein
LCGLVSDLAQARKTHLAVDGSVLTDALDEAA